MHFLPDLYLVCVALCDSASLSSRPYQIFLLYFQRIRSVNYNCMYYNDHQTPEGVV